MKKVHILGILTAILLMLIFSCSKSVTKDADIQYIPKGDSIYMKAQDTLLSNPLVARQMLEKEMRMRSVSDSTEWYFLYSLYIKTFYFTSEIDTIPQLCRRVEQYCDWKPVLSPREHYLMAEMYNIQGNAFTLISNNDTAVCFYKKMLEHARLSRNNRLLINVYNNLANAYVRGGHYVEGSSYYRQALFIADSLKQEAGNIISLYTGLGQTYLELRDYESAHHYYDLAYQRYDEMDLNNKFIYFTNMGSLCYFEENYPVALENFKQAYQLVSPYPELQYEHNVCAINMGELYLLMGKTDSAHHYLYKSYDYFKSVHNETAIYHTETQMLKLALEEKNIERATQILKTSLDTHYTEPRMINIRNKYLQDYYEKTGDYRKAYQYLKENVQLDDSTRNERIKMRVAEIDLRYKQDTTLMKQTIFIQQQRSDMQSLQLSFFIWIVVSLLILVTTAFLYFYQKKRYAYVKMQHRNKIIELRMESIRNRISPHFIFNTLNRVISNYKETDNEYKELYNLLKIMRLNLCLTEKLCVSLDEELDFVRTYLELEKQRFDSSLHIHIDIDSEIDTSQFLLPSMMIQIPVENALKHGLRSKEGKKILEISVHKDKNETWICIEDNGCGFGIHIGQQDTQSTGIGLKVLNQIIQLLNSGNDVPICLYIERSLHGTPEYPGCLIKFVIPDNYSYVLTDEK